MAEMFGRASTDINEYILSRMDSVMKALEVWHDAIAGGSAAIKAHMAGELTLDDIQRRDYIGDSLRAAAALDRLLLDEIVALQARPAATEETEAVDYFAKALVGLRRAVDAGTELVEQWQEITVPRRFGGWATAPDPERSREQGQLILLAAAETRQAMDYYKKALAAYPTD